MGSRTNQYLDDRKRAREEYAEELAQVAAAYPFGSDDVRDALATEFVATWISYGHLLPTHPKAA